MPARNTTRRNTAAKADATKEITVPTKVKTERPRVTLNSDIESEETVWPGQTRNSANAELKQRVTEDVIAMSEGSVRKYNNVGSDREQTAFLNLFRSVVKNVSNDKLTAQAIMRATSADGTKNDAVIVRLVAKVHRPRKDKTGLSAVS